MNKICIIFSLFLIITACEKSPTFSDELQEFLTKDNIISISGINREYDLFVPNNPNNSPIIVLLHGHGGSSDDLTGESGHKSPYKIWMSLAYANNIILIIPQGTIGADGNTGWNDCRADGIGNPEVDDLDFIEKAIDEVISKYSVNENKIYVTGTSNGGFMTMRIAQEMPEKLTAAAAIVASMPKNSECAESSIPISVLFMNGTTDPLVPYTGGQVASNRGDVMSAEEAVQYWVEKNQTDTIPEYTGFDNINTKDESTVEKYKYKNGTNDTEVVLYKVIGGGHTEPSILEQYSNVSKLILGNQNADIEMANEIWEFFKDKSK